MPCSQHNHTPWPTSGVHTLSIEACERECGWCNTISTSATNLRSHARKHLSNPNAMALHNITISSGKAGRKRVVLGTQFLSKQQHNQDLNTKLRESGSRDHAPDGVTSVFDRVEDEDENLRQKGSSYLASASLHEAHGSQARRGEDVDEISKRNASIETNDDSAQLAWVSSGSAGQERMINTYRDVRVEIDDLEKSIRKCSRRLHTFAANLPAHCPPVHRYGVESFITWCSLSSSSMLGLHEYFEDRHGDRDLESPFSSTKGSEDVASDRFTTAKIAEPAVAGNYAWPEVITPNTKFDHVGVERQSVEWEHLNFPLQPRTEPSKYQQLPSIDTMLSDRQSSGMMGSLTETAPLVQLQYDSTARSVHYTRTGRISKAKKGLKVHTCDCGRSYTRIEHLRRHQKNHATENALVCEYPGCGKTFHRAGLLLRHQERHNEGHIESGSSFPPAPACYQPPLPGTYSMRAIPPSSGHIPPHQAQANRDITSPDSTEMASPIHQSSSSQWLDLGSPTNVFDFFSEPLLEYP
ncbi:hypothetical protein BDU57DRAFT_514330 [Ampelomyces quisqualis]|uniref:C2H2-type domain-containing protein n=1 Tax=Ampelomyces quisqualis TaxID=50730 RepID=A0A6A5QSS1_AMPQU|nr:hypothetical protein BDU57DRAFT_514330 [Ampelomyces quisqualis]